MGWRGGLGALAIVGSVLCAGTVAAQEKSPEALRLEAERTTVLRDGDEGRVVLSGGVHLRFQRNGSRPRDRHYLDVRADDAVAFVPDEESYRKGGPPLRAFYAEGHARLEQRTAGGAPFVIEAARLYVDLVAERVVAIDAVARSPGAPRASGAGSTRAPGSVTLRAQRLRLEGAAFLEAEGAAVSICDFGLPHEALEATRLVLVERASAKERPQAIPTSAGLGGLGATAIARRAERDLPFRAFRDLTRRRAEPREGSDALFHVTRSPRQVTAEGTGFRVRPPFLGEEGLRLPLPVPLAWETDWPFPDVRAGRSSRFGVFALAEMRVPLLRAALAHEGKRDDHVRQGLDLDVLGGGGFYEQRGGTGKAGAAWEYFDERGRSVARGDVSGTYLHDRAPQDRNGSPVEKEDRYWTRGLHQQELPLGVHADAEFAKQSDRNYLREWERGVALTQKEQETYLYLRRSWDDLGARLIGRWRLNDFQSQTEELPRARIDWLSTPLVTHEVAGGLYLSSFVEAAHLRRRLDSDLFLGVPDERLGRFDGEARLDYKLPIGNALYLRAFGLGRFTAWSEREDDTGSIERFLGVVGARVGSQAEGVYRLSDALALRHALIPEAGYENRLLATRAPESLIAIDEVETYRRGNFVFLRLRNRLQWARSASGKESTELADLTIEGRYFPTDERLQPDRDRWGTLYGDARIYLGSFGTWRTVTELDPMRHRVIRLESQLTWNVTRWFLAATKPDGPDRRSPFPDVAIDASYRELADIARAVGWGATVHLTPSWSFRGEQLYDLNTRDFLRHRVTVRRDFHGFALEVAGTYDPILRDTAFSFSIVPSFDSSSDVPPGTPFDDIYGPR